MELFIAKKMNNFGVWSGLYFMKSLKATWNSIHNAFCVYVKHKIQRKIALEMELMMK